MDKVFDYSFKLNIQFPESKLSPGSASTDFAYIDQLLEALCQLIRATTWPESRQGEFLDYVTRDVHEFGLAIREEAAAGRWTAAASLMRPLQERSEFALAAAIDSEFSAKYIKYMESQIGKSFTGKSRNLVESARGTIRRWEVGSNGKDCLLQISVDLNKIGSELLHNGIGLSRESEEIVRARSGLFKVMSGRVHLGVVNVLLAIKVLGRNNTKAWHKALGTVSIPKA
ncbi:MAG: hypothetical protein OXE05_00575 [Chloroflexi bacterium]|nr:hypothetical protein [Chloroflexota bacterium]